MTVKRHDRIAIVATGPSLTKDTLHSLEMSGCYTIAVNLAVTLFKADAFFTCDPSDRNRQLMRDQVPGVKYYAAVPHDYGMPSAKPYHRAPRERNVTFLKRLTGDGPWSHKKGLAEDQDSIHTGNSAYGALNLAYHMRPRRVGFFGLDGTTGYAAGLRGAPGSLDHLPDIFATTLSQLAVRGIRVSTGNPLSKITCFPRMSSQEAILWLTE